MRRTHPMVEYYVLLLEEQLLQHSLEAEQIQWRIAERKSVFFHVLDQVSMRFRFTPPLPASSSMATFVFHRPVHSRSFLKLVALLYLYGKTTSDCQQMAPEPPAQVQQTFFACFKTSDGKIH